MSPRPRHEPSASAARAPDLSTRHGAGPLGRSEKDQIVIHGAREHNLRIDELRLPREAIVCVTGVSGSGKSSLCFATIYAEGQRRYLESLSSYARQFLQMMEKPDVDSIEGLSPAISIDQKTTSKNPRSTVATVTELYDYFRLLWARVGHPHCPACHRRIEGQSAQQIADRVMQLPEGTRVTIAGPVVRDRKGTHADVLARLRGEGFSRVVVDGVMAMLADDIDLDKRFKHDIDVVIDRIAVKDSARQRVSESVQTALAIADGMVRVVHVDEERADLYSERFACPEHGLGIVEMEPRAFSFNAPHGACERCHGIGSLQVVDPALLVEDPTVTIAEGAFDAVRVSASTWTQSLVLAAAKHFAVSTDTPWGELSPAERDLILHGGRKAVEFPVTYRNFMNRRRTHTTRFRGVATDLQRRYERRLADADDPERVDAVMGRLLELMTLEPCPDCRGSRLRPEVLAVTVGDASIDTVARMSVEDARAFFEHLDLPEQEHEIARRVIKEIRERLSFLDDVGLGYLTLNRAAMTLSGGESRRIQLSSSLAQALRGLTAILDEPSVGLHQRDNDRLIATMEHLRDQGNTVIVVEHDEQTQLSADWLVDIGPGAGEHGGLVVAEGTPEQVMRGEGLTAEYLSGRRFIPIPERREEDAGAIRVVGAAEHTLRGIDVSFPKRKFVCVTGVSGSGKSTLVNEILYKGVAHALGQGKARPGRHRRLEGVSDIERVIDIDQAPIGRTPRSNPATYTKVFDEIRTLYAMTPDAKARGYKPGRFSFNVKGGRCEVCKGDGYITKEMHFLPDIQVTCEVCEGRRFNAETLTVLYKGRSIADVLAMPVEEALSFFENIPKIRRRLQTLSDVGLGYIRLGQPATTLSGGEAQRVKLSTHLSRSSALNRGKLVILDEPTTGLSTSDIHQLLVTLQRMVDAGVSIVCIEHNLDVIKTADHVIDLGPEGGREGGGLVACGTPEEVASTPGSWTGQYLAETLARTREYMEAASETLEPPALVEREARTTKGPRHATSRALDTPRAEPARDGHPRRTAS